MPAAAVIPAPIAYIKVVAVKKLVVGYLSGVNRSTLRVRIWSAWGIFLKNVLRLIVWCVDQDFYLEEIRVLQAGASFEYKIME